MLDSLYHVVKTSKNDTVVADTHYELAWFLKLKDLPVAKAHMDSAMVVYQKLKLPRKLALGNFQYSVLHRVGGDYDEAIKSLTKYQDYVENVKDTANWIYAFYEKGVIYSQKGDLQKSLEQFYKANELSEATGNTGMANTSLNSIGLVYNDLGKYNEAIEAFNKALIGYKELDINTEHLGDVYNGLASAFKNQKQYDKAIENFDKAITVYELNASEFGIAIANFNKALIFNNQKRFKEALPLLSLAYEKQKSNGFNTELLMTISNLAEAHFELGNYNKSEAFLNEGLDLESESKIATKDLYFELYRINDKKNNFQKALKYHELYVVYKDSIYSEDNIKSINLLQKQFETERKDKEIAEQQLVLKEQETEIQQKKNQQNFMLGAIAFLIIVSLLIVLIYRQKQKRKNQELLALKQDYQIKSLELLIEGEEKERFRIAKELHDGVNGDLSAIKHKLSTLLEMNNKVIKEAITMIDSSCQQVRAISHNLVPPSLEKFTLVEATENYCTNLNAMHDEDISFQFVGDTISIPKKAQINSFRIIQELVTNAIKHAKAKTINVQISSRENHMQITVEDDGKGFNKDTIESEGIGLQTIDSRISYLNATLDFVSNTKGTSYIIEFDLNNLNED
ncbi:tetratricopeptide repeat protein [Psychroserpens sp. XS_ASV72]|uniref:tetratricopeptide repeat-containing sensor histidine kinase n=1 Tax=Psychroserpens sp. XS_ASV72 TaxID=3241293 RepID=UPI0035111290